MIEIATIALSLVAIGLSVMTVVYPVKTHRAMLANEKDDREARVLEMPTAPPHPSPKPIPGESDTATPMERDNALEANGEPHD